MAEEKITITIDEDGKISASTQGIKGEMCLTELEALLGKDINIQSVTKTDEYYQKTKTSNQETLKNTSKWVV